MVKRLIKYLLAGLVTILPVAIMIWLIMYVVEILITYLSVRSVIVGLLIIIVGLIPLGYIMTSYLGLTAWKNVEKSIFKIPLLGQVYKAIKDIVKSIVGTENKFTEPVIATINDGYLYKIGFVTNKDVARLVGNHQFGQEESTSMCLVYFPMSFSLAGDVFLVPHTKLKPVKTDAKKVMQTIISGGIIEIDPLEGVVEIVEDVLTAS